jgi:oligopeptide transport system substrate-binding protein
MKYFLLLLTLVALAACDEQRPLNDPYPSESASSNTLYSAFAERPKHLDPARAYSENEYSFIAQIYEPIFQYNYLKRPYTLEPLTAAELPTVRLLNADMQPLSESAPADSVAYSEYDIRIKPGIRYQPHPAFARETDGRYRYHALAAEALNSIRGIGDFPETATREVIAQDYAYQIMRLVHPQLHSPIAELMQGYIVGLKELGQQLEQDFRKQPPETFFDLRKYGLEGIKVVDNHHFIIRIKGKYPQFRFWLAMPFFAPMPWEAEAFYAQPGLIAKNISLDWYPVGSGAFMLNENNPNRRMTLLRNPNFHEERYPDQGEPGDKASGYLRDAGKQLPFLDRVVYTLEKESVPYWNKFLQGYYDSSGLSSDNFDQAVQFSGQGAMELSPAMKEKGIALETSITTTLFYMGFNMLDPVLGGYSDRATRLRQALGIAVDYEEFIAIFANGRGIPAQGVIPPGIYGHEEGAAGINPTLYDWTNGEARRKNLDVAKKLMEEAGYPGGIDSHTGKQLILYLDTAASGPDSKSTMNWYRKQFAKLGIQLVIRATDYNQFQQKMLAGNAQIYTWGWNADYPDPENFFFLLYGPNAKVGKGGENASNYQNAQFDKLFERMRSMDDGPERLALIRQMQDIIRHDAPWLFGYHPKGFALHHMWYSNLKPNQIANNELKYLRVDPVLRERERRAWNQPIFWPFIAVLLLLAIALIPAWLSYRKRQRATVS